MKVPQLPKHCHSLQIECSNGHMWWTFHIQHTQDVSRMNSALCGFQEVKLPNFPWSRVTSVGCVSASATPKDGSEPIHFHRLKMEGVKTIVIKLIMHTHMWNPILKLYRLWFTCKENVKIVHIKMQRWKVSNGEVSLLQQTLKRLILESLILVTLISFGWHSCWKMAEDRRLLSGVWYSWWDHWI